MSWRRNVSIYNRRKKVSSDLMLPVTSVSINWTWISEHYLQELRNPYRNSYRSPWKLWWDYYTISWHFHHTVSDVAVLLIVRDATWHSCWMEAWFLFFPHLLLGRRVGGRGIFTYTHEVIRTLNYQKKNLLITIKLLNNGTIEKTLAIWHQGQHFL